MPAYLNRLSLNSPGQPFTMKRRLCAIALKVTLERYSAQAFISKSSKTGLGMQELNRHLADTLRRLRKEKGWSLDKAAEETGVSKAMLGQIERGESSPTVTTLWKIAGGFQQSLSRFLEPPLSERNDTIIRRAPEIRPQPSSDEMLVAPFFPYEKRFGFEMFELTLLPGYERVSEPHERGVTEHVVVVSGKMELLIDAEWIELTVGSAVRFAADKPHGYRNRNRTPSVFHNLIHYG